jgi:hypothetical protein
MTVRRFSAPWSAELQPNYYVVRDADGQQIAYVYYSNDPERRSAAKLLTKDEARRRRAKNKSEPLIGGLSSGSSSSSPSLWGLPVFKSTCKILGNLREGSPL